MRARPARRYTVHPPPASLRRVPDTPADAHADTHTVLLVLHYDGARFAGWQRQRDARTVQGELEAVLARLCGGPIAVAGAGRTDAGVHARGQCASARVPTRWAPAALRRAMNALLPDDVWVARAHAMREPFHARFDATARRYAYLVGLDEEARSPFRRHREWAVGRALDRALLDASAARLAGDHCFRAFAVRGTAPADDHHRCLVTHAAWRERAGGLTFEVEANRFLHHMVRFLVGTMLDVATGRRPADDLPRLLAAERNDDVSPPAPAHALYLDAVRYPADLYLPEPVAA